MLFMEKILMSFSLLLVFLLQFPVNEEIAIMHPKNESLCYTRKIVNNNKVPFQILDPQGKKVKITFNKDGTLTFSPNSTTEIKELATGMAKTKIGLKMLQLIHA